MSDSPVPSAPRGGTQAVERALAVLELFRDEPDSLSLSDISRRLELNVSTTHRLVRALVAADFMEQDPVTERYRLGFGIAVLGQRALARAGFGSARQILTELVRETGESAALGVLRHGEIVVVERIEGTQPLRFDHQLGAELAVHASAMGKAILAHSGDAVESAIRAFGTLSAFTASTITTAEELEMELARVRANGFAVNRGERYDGVTGVAAPILDHHGAAYAAIGVQGPSVRLTDERIAEVARVVTDAAASMRAS